VLTVSFFLLTIVIIIVFFLYIFPFGILQIASQSTWKTFLNLVASKSNIIHFLLQQLEWVLHCPLHLNVHFFIHSMIVQRCYQIFYNEIVVENCDLMKPYYLYEIVKYGFFQDFLHLFKIHFQTFF